MAASLAPSLHTPRLLPLLPNPTPSPSPAFPSTSGGPRRRRLHRLASTRNGSSPGTEWCPVPPEQLPVNEYEALAASLPFSWAAGDLRLYCSRLALTGAAFALFVGLPVAAFGGRGGAGDGVHLALGATGSGILAVTLAVVRMYLGWAYVGNRLLSATVEYEETGWYDGQIWVKTPEVLARDRLLGSFSVKPVLNRVKFTLVGLAASLTLCILLYVNTEKPKEPFENTSGRAIPGVYSDTAARSFEPDALFLECTVTLLRGHLSLMHSAENLISVISHNTARCACYLAFSSFILLAGKEEVEYYTGYRNSSGG